MNSPVETVAAEEEEMAPEEPGGAAVEAMVQGTAAMSVATTVGVATAAATRR